jgi:beta-glucosidase
LRTHSEHARGLPIYVTENGMASANPIEDPDRIGYLAGHLAAVLRAIAQGANVRGWFCWSMFDNYEWAFGYEKRFGLVHVDFDSLQRRPKDSYHALARALARNG